MAAVTALATITAVPLGTGCRGDDKIDVPGLVTSAEASQGASIDQAVASSEALVAFTRAPRLTATDLPDTALTSESTVTLTAGDTQETLTTTSTLELARNGDMRLVTSNSEGYGREVVALGDTLYLRPTFAKWLVRAPRDREIAGILTQAAAEFAGHLEVIAGGIAVRDGGAVQHLGRAAHKVLFEHATTTKPTPAPQTTSQGAWRASVVVANAVGHAIVDDATGVVLDGALDAAFSFTRDGKPVVATLTVKQRLTAANVAVAPPPAGEIVRTPERAHDVDDANVLLKDL